MPLPTAATVSGPVAVELFSTSILSNHKVRARHERYTSVLTIKKIPYIYHDLASDPEAKSRWRRKAIVDPSIPGLLVHNEWRGTFEEFEEAVEFGELDLFLKIDAERLEREGGPQPAVELLAPGGNGPSVPSSAGEGANGTADKRNFSSAALPAPPPFAPEGSGKRTDETADEFLASLGVDKLDLSDKELDELLADLPKGQAAAKARGEIPAGDQLHPSSTMTITGERIPSRTYVPSADAGVKPLRLARMGSGAQQPVSPRASPAGSALSPSGSTGSIASPSAVPRYSASQRSGKALAAEAAATVKSREFSGKLLRDAVSSGKLLQEAMEDVKMRSSSYMSTGSYRERGTVGAASADELLAILGLGDLDITEEEAEAFLRDGDIPEGLETGGSRLPAKPVRTAADKAREEVAAREVAHRAREKGYGQSRRTDSVTSIGSGDASRNSSQASPQLAAPALEEAETSMVVHEDQPHTPLESLTPSNSHPNVVKGEVEASKYEEVTGVSAEDKASNEAETDAPKVTAESATIPLKESNKVDEGGATTTPTITEEESESEAPSKAADATPRPSPPASPATKVPSDDLKSPEPKAQDTSVGSLELPKAEGPKETPEAPSLPSSSSSQSFNRLDLFPPVKAKTATSTPSPSVSATSPSLPTPSVSSPLASSTSSKSLSFEDQMSASPPKYSSSAKPSGSANTSSSVTGGTTTVTVVRYDKNSFDAPVPAPKAVVSKESFPTPPQFVAPPPDPPKDKKPTGHQRTLSDILRDADAAMQEGEDLDTDLIDTDAALTLDYL